MYGYVKPGDPKVTFDEVVRARNLCESVLILSQLCLHTKTNGTHWSSTSGIGEWGKRLGIDGFVRMNTGFELMKCDFEDGLGLVSHLNVTEWRQTFDPMPPGETDRERRCMSEWLHDGFRITTTHGLVGALQQPEIFGNPLDGTASSSIAANSSKLYVFETHTGPPRKPHVSIWLDHAWFEWARTATLVYNGLGEQRVKLDTSTFVTAYGRTGVYPSSNSSDHKNGEWKLQERKHRLTNVTSQAARDIKADIEKFWRGGETRRTERGIDWEERTDLIVGRYGERLPTLANFLHQALNGSTNKSDFGLTAPNTTALESARHLVAILVLPHYTHSAKPSSSLSLAEQNLAACISFLAPDIDDSMVALESEQKIARVIRLVQREVCSTLLFANERLAFAASLLNQPPPYTPSSTPTPSPIGNSNESRYTKARDAISATLFRISDLMSNKLRWKSWKSCPRRCETEKGELCLITLWPAHEFDFGKDMEPRCSNRVGSVFSPQS